MHTFDVSDVPMEPSVLRMLHFEELLAQRLSRPLEAMASNSPAIAGCLDHPFVSSVSRAFSGHLPLALSPDDIWLCLVQGIGTHFNLHPEILRKTGLGQFGKERLTVRRDAFVRGSPDNDWAGVFAEFAQKIEERAPDVARRLLAGFSTTGLVERAAFQVGLMSAMQSCFDYRAISLCGIPRITLLGSVADWMAVRERAEELSAFGPQTWQRALLPVLDQFVGAAQGHADRDFWRSIYKSDERSGGAPVTGWINVFFPYINVDDPSATAERSATRPQPNPHLAAWQTSAHRADNGPLEYEFGSGLATVPLIWECAGTTLAIDIVAGFVGVAQDPESLTVRPATGWALCHDGTAVGGPGLH